MKSSKQILQATGLKSMRTLTRWHQRGLIPAPIIKTHPSGRGKLAYWPDHILDRCKRILELRRTGLSIDEAARMAEREERIKVIDAAGPDLERFDQLWDKHFDFIESVLPELCDEMARTFAAVVEAETARMCPGFKLGSSIKCELNSADTLRRVVELIRAGYDPLVVISGNSLKVVPGVTTSYSLSELTVASFIIPVLPIAQEAIPILNWPWKLTARFQPNLTLMKDRDDLRWEYPVVEKDPGCPIADEEQKSLFARREEVIVDGEREEHWMQA